MSKKITLIIGVLVLVMVSVVGGMFAYKKWDESRSKGNVEYTNCVEEVTAQQEKNEKIVKQVDADIEKCTRDYIKAQGYNDDVNCIEDYENPVCDQEKYDEDGTNIGRYNAEVNGGNQCMEDREQRLLDAGYENVSVMDCTKYLGDSPDSVVEKTAEIFGTNKTYVCEDYFGERYEVVYNDKDLVSVSGDADIESERNLMQEEYDGNVEAYISAVEIFCND